MIFYLLYVEDGLLFSINNFKQVCQYVDFLKVGSKCLFPLHVSFGFIIAVISAYTHCRFCICSEISLSLL